MYNDMDFASRVAEFVNQYVYNRGKVDVMMNRLGLTFRKGRTSEDIKHAYAVANKKSVDTMSLLQNFTIILGRDVLKDKK